MELIYAGGQIPTLAIQDDSDSRFYGWLFYKHPDGQWVSLADVKAWNTRAEGEQVLRGELARIQGGLNYIAGHLRRGESIDGIADLLEEHAEKLQALSNTPKPDKGEFLGNLYRGAVIDTDTVSVPKPVPLGFKDGHTLGCRANYGRECDCKPSTVSVPVEPTEKMIKAGMLERGIVTAYKAMIAAAQEKK